MSEMQKYRVVVTTREEWFYVVAASPGRAAALICDADEEPREGESVDPPKDDEQWYYIERVEPLAPADALSRGS